MNESLKYEKLIQEIYQELLKEQGLTTQVKHDVKLQGKSATHQIDVYWEYTFGGVNHRVAIECKNYNTELSIAKVRDFYGVLSDIGSINGILVTKVGYQKGAKKFAEYYGINLVVIRKPLAEDWNGRIKTLVTDIEAISQYAKKWFVELDYEWCKQNIVNDKLESLSVVISGMNSEIWLYDEDGNKLKNFLQLEENLPYNENSLLDNEHFYKFESTYIPSEKHGKIKIKGVRVWYDTNVTKSQLTFDGEDITKAIFKDICTGEMRFIKNNTL